MTAKFRIHEDIRQAETLPAEFYRDTNLFNQMKENVFMKSWQWIGDEEAVKLNQQVFPFVLLDQFLTEPMLLTRDDLSVIRCLSNVCTHRGNIVSNTAGMVRKLVCRYHGRSFKLNGEFENMPEFKDVKEFPRPCDNLHEFQLHHWNQFLFVRLDADFDFKIITDKINERVWFLPLNKFKLNKMLSKDYLVHAHWALYCDNYLEGFHIPFVHGDLNAVIDYGNYKTEIYDYCNLQIAYSNSAEEIFDLPADHIDYGKNVAAYYYWIFPNLMLNFYPWGLSVNLVQPLSIDRTKVSFLTYVYDESKLNQGAGALLDKVEREDEYVVEGVHNGVKSRFYKAGRFSPARELGVHQFHRLLAEFTSCD